MFNKGDVITILWSDRKYECTAIGRGEYPWDCAAKKNFPNAMIFRHASKLWWHEHELEMIGNNKYHVKGW